MSGNIPRIVIAGTQSGVGKTSISTGLTRALIRRGLRVQTFKAGPDFLDPTYLALASGRPCYNLDGWMCGRPYVCELFQAKAASADLALIEGVMGLYDGASPETSEGSTAEIARWLEAPVLLVANAKGMARSFAAMVKGYQTFEPGSPIAAVIANQCGSERHAAWLSEALASADLPRLAGTVPHGAFPVLPSRRLGLVTADKTNLDPSTLDALADAVERHLDVPAILKLAQNSSSGEAPVQRKNPSQRSPVFPAGKIRIGIALDQAFHFYYPDNLEALEASGACLVPFSPIGEARLPDNLSMLYFGGGYPEEHAAELSANDAMREAACQFAAAGGAIYAECGGLMYLAQGIETPGGMRHRMLGILPVWTRMLAKRKALGYVEVKLNAATFLGEAGDQLRGHEFHYSELIEAATPDHGWQPAYETRYRRQSETIPAGFQRGRILAGYAHVHFGSHPKAAESIVEFAARRDRS